MKYLTIIMLCVSIQACEVEQKKIAEDPFIERKMEKMFSKLTTEGDSLLFKMDTLTNFQWDSLYVFKYYQDSEDDINKFLEGKWVGNTYLGHEGDNIFVFKNKSNIVSYVNFGVPDTNDIYFHCSCEVGYTPENGIFKVKLNYASKAANDKSFYEMIAQR